MKIDRDVMSLPTWVGTIASIFTGIILTAFTALKINVLISRDDINVLVANREFFFEDDYLFDYKQGLNIAAAFVDYSAGHHESILDPTYGELVYKSYEWGTDLDNPDSTYSGRTSIPSHPCSRDELGLEGADQSKSHFFPIHKDSYRDIDYFSNSFQCIEPDTLSLKGDFNS